MVFKRCYINAKILQKSHSSPSDEELSWSGGGNSTPSPSNFSMKAESFNKGARITLAGTMPAKNLRKNSFSSVNRKAGLSLLPALP